MKANITTLFTQAQQLWQNATSSQNSTLGLSQKTFEVVQALFQQFDRKQLEMLAAHEQSSTFLFYRVKACKNDLIANSKQFCPQTPHRNFNAQDDSCLSLEIEGVHLGPGIVKLPKGKGQTGNSYHESLQCIVAKELPNPICFRKGVAGAQTIECEDIDFDKPEIPKGTPLVPKLSFVGEVGKIGLGCISTLYFTYKAYQEIRNILKERKQKKEDPNLAETNNTAQSALSKQKKPSASPRKALGYTAAAVCSGAYTFFKWRDFDERTCLSPPWRPCTHCVRSEDIDL